jgi:hypothetical protein
MIPSPAAVAMRRVHPPSPPTADRRMGSRHQRNHVLWLRCLLLLGTGSLSSPSSCLAAYGALTGSLCRLPLLHHHPWRFAEACSALARDLKLPRAYMLARSGCSGCLLFSPRALAGKVSPVRRPLQISLLIKSLDPAHTPLHFCSFASCKRSKELYGCRNLLARAM